ncbi:MAG: cbb3-type cytochrome c oxidase subunit I [Leptospiraceae bacterium]|nr:cbb3-type cytochrome c oxidase subunit I [Leptospiraceae bacterium]
MLKNLFSMAQKPETAIKSFAGAGLFWVFISVLLGLVSQLQLFMDLGIPGGYGFTKPLFHSSLIFGAILGIFQAGAIFIVNRDAGGDAQYSILAIGGFKLQQLGLVIGLAGIALGANNGREFGEFNFIADNLMLLGLLHVIAMVLINTWNSASKINLVYVNATLGGMFGIYFVGNFGLPFSPLATVPLFTGMQDQYIQEVYRLGIYCFYIAMPLIALFSTIVPDYLNVPLYSESMARFHILGSILVLPVAAAAWLAGTAAPQFLQSIGVFAALAFYTATFAGAMNICFTVTRTGKTFKLDSLGEWLKYGARMIMILALIRGIASFSAVQNLTAYTWFNVRDVSFDAQTYGLFIMIVALFYVMQITMNHTFGQVSLRLMLILGGLGLLLALTANITQGFYQGALAARTNAEGQLAITDWNQILVAGSWYGGELKEQSQLLTAWMMSLRSVYLLGHILVVLGLLIPTFSLAWQMLNRSQGGYQKPELAQ